MGSIIGCAFPIGVLSCISKNHTGTRKVKRVITCAKLAYFSMTRDGYSETSVRILELKSLVLKRTEFVFLWHVSLFDANGPSTA